MVKSGGHVYRLAREPLAHGVARSGWLRNTHAVILKIGQTAVCHPLYTVDTQLGRWLLSSADRLPPAELVMMQESVSGLLGMRHDRISHAASKLRDGGDMR
ncbi:hypothetical protein [Polaromonas glacialis]|uniref:hypothetical protein n=1 Tax=Polaromonas glacialis TaxID=866564 RepID=UPI00068D7D1B|nr:hypothetical protein [Polaromonas glacialis]